VTLLTQSGTLTPKRSLVQIQYGPRHFSRTCLTPKTSMGHHSCRTNFTEALEPWGIAEWQIPDPFDFFQNAPVHPDRVFGNEVPTGKAGDKLVLRTLMDSIVSVSACLQDLNPCNRFHPSPLMIRILGP
jgi:uncharacterized protein YcgI (DUF1989 family)